tara:strand:- start:1148 stop:1414 length:267 start_codon:yes stop_codon:yes gene_type:complete
VKFRIAGASGRNSANRVPDICPNTPAQTRLSEKSVVAANRFILAPPRRSAKVRFCWSRKDAIKAKVKATKLASQTGRERYSRHTSTKK